MNAVRRFFRINLLELFGLVSLLCLTTAGALQGSDLVADWARLAATVVVLVVYGLACGSSGKSRALHAAFVGGAIIYHVLVAANIFSVVHVVARYLWDLFGDTPDDSSATLAFLTYSEMTAQCGLTILAGWLCRRIAYATQDEDSTTA